MRGGVTVTNDTIPQTRDGRTTPCGRRMILKTAIGATVGLTIARTAGLVEAAGLVQDDPVSSRPQPGDLLVRVSDSAAAPLKASDVQPGPPIVAWSMDPTTRTVRSGSRFNQLLVLKLDAATLGAETQARAADGIVAYTIICTHSGCDVEGWIADSQLLFCSCHSSSFDPKSGAKVVDGPAPRSLPALPLRVVDGALVVSAPFTERVGFESA
jgi:Rieske Fe-S protein